VQLTLDLAADPIIVMLRPGDIDQVLLNLVVNARDALPDGGRITVRIHATDGTAELATVQSIVTQSLGSVDVSSTPSSGTRFSVRWPVSG